MKRSSGDLRFFVGGIVYGPQDEIVYVDPLCMIRKVAFSSVWLE